jgi:DNA topoisomerase-3
MRVVLAEKPSVARELAAFLGAATRREGYFEGRGTRVTWALGHLATLKEPEDYDPALKRWSLATLPFVPDSFELKLLDEKGAGTQFRVIERLLRSADEIVCATDAGREGELIFRYIQELAGATGKNAFRLWLNSLTAAAIGDAFRRLRPLSDYDALYAAARCRSRADWVVGLNATRYYTVRHRDAGGLLWSVGRVQTPVLALIVRRDDEIRGFRPEPFWELLTLYRAVTFKFAGERFGKEEDARTALDRVRGL